VELAERLLGKGYELKIYDPNVIAARLTGANKQYIDSVIPHLSRLLVPSLDDFDDAEMLLVGHHFPGVAALLERTQATVIDLGAYPVAQTTAADERELVQI
jgi:GDP-mannose 6-dehydrogenase